MFKPASQLVIKIRSKLQSLDNLFLTFFVALIACFITIIVFSFSKNEKIISPIVSPIPWLGSININQNKGKHEVFGFAPYWTFNKLDNVDFNVLTTLAYFGVTVNADGNLDRTDVGYYTFQSKKATQIFTKAHNSGTRVVLTITQMENWNIINFLDNPEAQTNAIEQIITEVKNRNIDGVNVDIEYAGNPEQEYRDKYTKFVTDLTDEMHKSIPYSRVTVSVYAGSVKSPKLYDIKALSSAADGIFMMAYDFAVLYEDNAIPTAPLYGHKEGKYWYDVATAVDDFLKVMPAEKLILGVPWYSYNYLVYEPKIKSATYYSWMGGPKVQTYSAVQEKVNAKAPNTRSYKSGWDNLGQVAWKSYFDEVTGGWRMLFFDDAKSMGIKVDFAKDKNLAGIGIWALGFDAGRQDFWKVLEEKFGIKLADNAVVRRIINENI